MPAAFTAYANSSAILAASATFFALALAAFNLSGLSFGVFFFAPFIEPQGAPLVFCWRSSPLLPLDFGLFEDFSLEAALPWPFPLDPDAFSLAIICV